MQVVSIHEAQTNLAGLMAQTVTSHEPIQITGNDEQVVLIAESDWRSIQETLYLLSVPGMRESIREGINTPLAECAKELDW
ncbi:MAG: type II toxin-antitoxin system Phd/YefM family antitoxin [Acidobacteriota bacterium]